jgi:uncharacterized iron-regulated protein
MTPRKQTLAAVVGAVTATLIALALLSSCTGGAPRNPEPDPAPEPVSAHPLSGRVWDARRARFVERDQLIAEAASADHVLLGEVHVNPHHHTAQAAVLEALVARGARPAVVFEMMEVDQQGAIDALRAEGRPSADEIAAATRFAERGWDWPLYRPLVELALQHDLPILAGNSAAAETRLVMMEGQSAIDDERRQRLGLDRPLTPGAQAALEDIMVESHCGHASREFAVRLVDAQRLRDGTMADVMLGAEGAATVLITGSGHARRDHGVPLYLADRAPGARLVSVRLVEVADGFDDPADYLDQVDGQPRPFDVLWFTPAIERPDPCEQFREGLKRLERSAD